MSAVVSPGACHASSWCCTGGGSRDAHRAPWMRPGHLLDGPKVGRSAKSRCMMKYDDVWIDIPCIQHSSMHSWSIHIHITLQVAKGK